MKVWVIVLISVVSLIGIFFLIKFLTRNKGESFSSSSGGSLWDKVKDACCIKN